jgi:excisionase family DNA binding protein
MPDQSCPVLLDLKSAAQYLSTTTWAVRRLLWRGELPYKRVGKKFCIPRVALDEWASKDLKREGVREAMTI